MPPLYGTVDARPWPAEGSKVRALLRIVLLIMVVAALAAFFFRYRFANRGTAGPGDAVGTTGGPVVDRDVNTVNGAVTLNGTVESTVERDRAVRLAPGTDGVTSRRELLTIRR